MLKKALLALLTLALLTAALLPLALASENGDEINVDFRTSASQYDMGEQVDIYFDITGGARPFVQLSAGWKAWCDYGSASSGFADDLNHTTWNPQTDGTLSSSIQLTDAYMVELNVEIIDANNQFHSFSKSVNFQNRYSVEPPLSVSSSNSADTVAVGEEFTTSYSLSGEYTDLKAEFVTVVGDNTIYHDEIPLDSPQGSLSYTPQEGEEAYLSITATDLRGVQVSLECEHIAVTGSRVTPVTLSAVPDVTSARPGDVVTVQYAVSGGAEEYREIFGYWGSYINSEFNENEYFNCDPAQTSGSLTLTIPEGWERCALYLYAFDTNGQMGSVISDWIEIGGFSVSLTAETDTLIPGQPVQVHYQVTGGAQPVQSVMIRWREIWNYTPTGAVEAAQGSYNLTEYFTDAEGNISYTPTRGSTLSVLAIATDANGAETYGSCQFQAEEPRVEAFPENVSLNIPVNSVAQSDVLPVYYQLPEDATQIFYSWFPCQDGVIMDSENDYPLFQILEDTSGAFAVAPNKGNGIKLNMRYASGGVTVEMSSIIIPVTPAPQAELTVTYPAGELYAYSPYILQYTTASDGLENLSLEVDWQVQWKGAAEPERYFIETIDGPMGPIGVPSDSAAEWVSGTVYLMRNGVVLDSVELDRMEVHAQVALTCDRDTCAIGDTVTVHYKVVADCDTVNYCFTPYLGGQGNPDLEQGGELTAMEGDVSYTVTAGDSLQVIFDLYKNEEWVDNSTLDLPVTGYPYGPIVVSAAIDADTATVGVPLTFHYSVTGGSGSYESVDVYMDQQNKAYDRAGDGWYENEMRAYQGCGASGTLTYLPTQAGDYIKPTVIVHDREGWYAFYNGNDGIQVQPGTISTLELPHDLKIIEASAFEGVDAQMVILPDGCETIGPRAFANSSVRVVVIPGSVTAIDDTAFDGLPESFYLLDISEENDEVWRMVQKLGCSYMTHVAFGW